MTDLAVGPVHPAALGGAEDGTVEVDRGAAAVDDQVGRDARVIVRYWLRPRLRPPRGCQKPRPPRLPRQTSSRDSSRSSSRSTRRITSLEIWPLFRSPT